MRVARVIFVSATCSQPLIARTRCDVMLISAPCNLFKGTNQASSIITIRDRYRKYYVSLADVFERESLTFSFPVFDNVYLFVILSSVFSNSVHVACSRMFLFTSNTSFCYFFDFLFFVTQFPMQNTFLCSFLLCSKTVIAYVSTIVQRAWQKHTGMLVYAWRKATRATRFPTTDSVRLYLYFLSPNECDFFYFLYFLRYFFGITQKIIIIYKHNVPRKWFR